MVPLSCGGGRAAGGAAGGGAAGGGAAAGGAAGGGAAGAGSGALGTAGAFIISIVPLNFGAADPFKLKPHFEQVVAVSGFWVPQFGQNTFEHLRARRTLRRGEGGSLHALRPGSQERIAPAAEQHSAFDPQATRSTPIGAALPQRSARRKLAAPEAARPGAPGAPGSCLRGSPP